MSARLGVGERSAGDEVQGSVVVDAAVFHAPAVAVVGVLAQAHIGDHGQFRQGILQHRVARWTMPSSA